jgi:hypothetical protein
LIVSYKDKKIDISNIKKVAPSVKVKLEDIVTPISIEWFEDNKNSVEFISYLALIYFNDDSKIDLEFESEEEMFEVLIELDRLIQSLER